jgi:hypothetical protein
MLLSFDQESIPLLGQTQEIYRLFSKRWQWSVFFDARVSPNSHSQIISQYAEDQTIQISAVNCLWSSLSPKHKLLSVVKIRDCAGQLTGRSLLSGSASEGVALHGT